jgi:uncharacterized membrane protein
LHVPELEAQNLAELPARLLALWPNFLTYALSFVSLGVYWVGHRNQFAFIERSDRPLSWITIGFLLFVALIPFSTALLGRYPLEPVAVMTYGLNLVVVGLMLFWHWRYATGRGGLVGNEVNGRIVRLASRRILTGPLAYLLAVGIAPFAPRLSLVVYLLVPLYYILPGHFDRHLKRFAKPENPG